MYLIDKAREVAGDISATVHRWHDESKYMSSQTALILIIIKSVLFLTAAALYFSGAGFASNLALGIYFGFSVVFYVLYFKRKRA